MLRISLASSLAALALLGLASACTGSAISGSTGATPADTAGDLARDEGAPDPGVADPGGDPGPTEDAPVDVGPEVATDIPIIPPQWNVSPLGDLGVLADVHAVSPDEAYAVGGTRVLRYNGRTWAAFGDPTPDRALRGVWAHDGVVFAVGDGGTLARRAAGELTWTLDDAGVDVDLYAVYGRAADDVWAVGDETRVLHFDGTSWEQVHSGSNIHLRAVWVDATTTGPDGVIAVGTAGRLVRHDGAAWTNQQIAAGTVTLHDVLGLDGTLFAVGTGATITLKTPQAATWKGQASNDSKSRDLYALAGGSDHDVVAVGASGAVIHYDGAKWNVQVPVGPVYVASQLVSVTRAAGGGEAAWMAVGASGGGLRLSGTSWVDLPTQPDAELRDLAGPPGGPLWAAGRSGLLMTETADQGWTAVPTGTEADLSGVAVAADGTVWAVGDAGTVLHKHPGEDVDILQLGVPVALYGVALDGERVVISGKGGTLLEGTAADLVFVPRNSGTLSDLRAVTFASDGALWLAGAFGTLLRSEAGALPSPVTTGVGGSLNAIAATTGGGAGGVVVVGDNGVVLAADAAGATLLDERPGIFLYGVSATAAATFAVGWNGTVVRGDDGAFAVETTGTNAVLEAVWHDATRAVATGRQGVLLERVEAP